MVSKLSKEESSEYKTMMNEANNAEESFKKADEFRDIIMRFPLSKEAKLIEVLISAIILETEICESNIPDKLKMFVLSEAHNTYTKKFADLIHRFVGK